MPQPFSPRTGSCLSKTAPSLRNSASQLASAASSTGGAVMTGSLSAFSDSSASCPAGPALPDWPESSLEAPGAGLAVEVSASGLASGTGTAGAETAGTGTASPLAVSPRRLSPGTGPVSGSLTPIDSVTIRGSRNTRRMFSVPELDGHTFADHMCKLVGIPIGHADATMTAGLVDLGGFRGAVNAVGRL
jgi:hypothetical protein